MLRSVDAANLVDNATIVEDNITVARFLQSIDYDGDLHNGIQIPTDVRGAIAGAFEAEGVSGVPSGNMLDTIIGRLDQNITGFRGFVQTEAQAREHVNQTQTEIVKEILADKTFYAVTEPSGTFLGQGVRTGDTGYIIPMSFNHDVTMLNEGTEAATEIRLDGKRIVYPSDPQNYQVVEGTTAKYVKVETVFVAGSGTVGHMRFYFNQRDAQAYIDTFSSGSTGGTDTTGGSTTTGGTDTTGGSTTTGGTTSSALDLSGYNIIHLYNNYSENMAQITTGTYNSYIEFAHSTTTAPTHCTDYGFSELVSNINIGVTTQKLYRIVNETGNETHVRRCYEEDYSQAPAGFTGSTNLVLRWVTPNDNM